MATDISKVKALDDFPPTPYATGTSNQSLAFRWIHAQCFQFRLPDGTVLMTDPFLPQNPRAWRRDNTPILDPEQIGRVDYVTVNHAHFDHCADLPSVFRHNSPIVICDRIFARELSAAYRIPEFNIHPIIPGNRYEFQVFSLDTVEGKHNDIGTVCELDGGPLKDETNPLFGPLNSYGCLFNTSFLFTLQNGFRIGFAAGVDVKTTADAWRHLGVNLLLRQRLIYADSEDYAKDCEELGGQLVLPMHHDASFDWNADMNAYSQSVNAQFEAHHTAMRMFNPERLKWYTIQMGIYPMNGLE